MITTPQYFQGKPHGEGHRRAAEDLLVRRNRLRREWMEATGREACPVDLDTGTEVSGSRGGTGDGGFRLTTASTGRTLSSHKEARGVDDYDPDNAFDTWLDTFETGAGHNSKLEEYGLYREHPDSTPGWCHLTTRPPGSGRRTFWP